MLSTRSLRAVNAAASFLMTAIALHLLSKQYGQAPVVTGESWARWAAQTRKTGPTEANFTRRVLEPKGAFFRITAGTEPSTAKYP
ncbi:hypothetical protein Save01_07697 [Streptomyces avermitilis]|uniref:Secreted protein n=2 Tax=Streptomyces avermitilis TaxID=33903 RepID=A0A143SZR9_STRAW|nr:hypothetical protein SAVERM_2p105 [Streptomyces avermitilis MA-4680 = NBRC 14893]GDY70215.1 hypothetical protein SAV14893_096080 [Streptomyces avermitilis]GDY80519.1 hypothetical protein SAV31267_100040 [Streptomyces avermitilis]